MFFPHDFVHTPECPIGTVENYTLAGTNSPNKEAFGFFLFVFEIVGCWTMVLIFYINRRKYDRLKVRQTLLVATTATAGTVHAVVGPWVTAVGRDNQACAVRNFFTLMIIPLGAGALIGRLLIFNFLSRYTQAIAQRGRMRVIMEEPEDQTAEQYTVTLLEDADVGRSGGIMTMREESAWKKHWRRTRYLAKVLLSTDVSRLMNDISFDDRAESMYVLRFLVSNKGYISLVAVFVVPWMIVSFFLLFSDPVFFRGCTHCIYNNATLFCIFFQLGSACIMGAMMAYSTRRLKDPWGLATEARLMLIGYIFGGIGFVLATYYPAPLDSAFDLQIMLTGGIMMSVFSMSVYQVFLGWRAHRAHPSEGRRDSKLVVSTNATPSAGTSRTSRLGQLPRASDLNQIMSDARLEAAFEKHLVAELGLESLYFLRDTSEWIKSYNDVGSSARLARARRIYKAYVDTNGMYSINIDGEQLRDIKQNLLDESAKDISIHVFDAVRDEIARLLERGAVHRFHATKEYRTLTGTDVGTVL